MEATNRPGDQRPRDARLWCRLSDGSEVILIGNAHTHRGRIHAEDLATGRLVTMSLVDITEASEHATVWLQGFLSGCEPDLVDVFPELEEISRSTPEQVEEWRVVTAEFRESGSWIERLPRPLAED